MDRRIADLVKFTKVLCVHNLGARGAGSTAGKPAAGTGVWISWVPSVTTVTHFSPDASIPQVLCLSRVPFYSLWEVPRGNEQELPTSVSQHLRHLLLTFLISVHAPHPLFFLCLFYKQTAHPQIFIWLSALGVQLTKARGLKCTVCMYSLCICSHMFSSQAHKQLLHGVLGYSRTGDASLHLCASAWSCVTCTWRT